MSVWVVLLLLSVSAGLVCCPPFPANKSDDLGVTDFRPSPNHQGQAGCRIPISNTSTAANK